MHKLNCYMHINNSCLSDVQIHELETELNVYKGVAMVNQIIYIFGMLQILCIYIELQ